MKLAALKDVVWTIYKTGTKDVVFTSTEVVPVALLDEGVYDVHLQINSTNPKISIIKDSYIHINGKYNDILVDGPNFETVSLNFGLNSAMGSGWSVNTGDNWVMPLHPSQALIKIINGEQHMLVNDFKEKAFYKIGTNDSHNFKYEFLDKGKYPIECFVKTMTMGSDTLSDVITHEETVISVVPADGDKVLPMDFSVDAELYDEYGDLLETNRDVNHKKEITFRHTNNKIIDEDTRRIGLRFKSARFALQFINTILRVNDKFTRGAKELEPGYEKFLIDNTVVWYSRMDYDRELISGARLFYNDDGKPLDTKNDLLMGPDGMVDSAVAVKREFDVHIDDYDYNKDYLIMFFSTNEIYRFDYYDVKHHGFNGSWMLYSYIGGVDSVITIPKDITLFDLRIIDVGNMDRSIVDDESLYSIIIDNLPEM